VDSERAKLRPVHESDLGELVRLVWDPDATGEFQWFGFRMAKAREIERRWHDDGLTGGEASFLTVESDDGCAGWVTWRVLPTGNVEIGIALFPEYRGRGIGTEAQRQRSTCSTRRRYTGSKQAPRSTTWPSRVR
jgi:RimJ/RimL family protein N-acetyltransferase